MSKDYYKILGVDQGASQEEIKKAFRTKAHKCHPDKAGGDEAKFKEINEAYQVLGDAKKRSQYDQFGSAFENAQAGGGFHGFDGFRDYSNYANGFNVNMDDLGDIFGGIGDIFGFGGRKSRSRRGADIQALLTVEFNEAVFGCEKEVNLKKTVKCDHCKGNLAEPGTKIDTCKTCNGTGRTTGVQRTILGNMQVQMTCEKCKGEGKTYAELCKKCSGRGIIEEQVKLNIKIPAGINDGETIRLTEQGEAGEKGANSGDLYIKVQVKPDNRFERRGDNILSKSDIGFTQAAIGAKIDIETVDGFVSLKIPAGTQSGTIFKLKSRGAYSLHSNKRGDHLVEVIVNTPKNINRQQKKLLEELDL